MYSVKYTTLYKKMYKLMAKRGWDMSLIESVVATLAAGKPLDPKYKDHALTGDKADFRECHIQPDWLLVYKIEKKVLILTLINTGTHSDIFKK